MFKYTVLAFAVSITSVCAHASAGDSFCSMRATSGYGWSGWALDFDGTEFYHSVYFSEVVEKLRKMISGELCKAKTSECTLGYVRGYGWAGAAIYADGSELFHNVEMNITAQAYEKLQSLGICQSKKHHCSLKKVSGDGWSGVGLFFDGNEVYHSVYVDVMVHWLSWSKDHGFCE